MSRLVVTATLALVATLLTGCDMIGGALGIESPEKVAATREAEGKAIGGACRHAGRAIEDCYALNKKADKAAIFAGWRDMNDYMRENKIDPVAPMLAAQPAAQFAKAAADSTDEVVKAAPKATAPAGKPRKAARDS
jgi:hypothetical protein